MWFLTSVNENMPIQVSHLSEQAIANLALERAVDIRLCRFFVAHALVYWDQREMCILDVINDFRRAIKRCTTNWTQLTLKLRGICLLQVTGYVMKSSPPQKCAPLSVLEAVESRGISGYTQGNPRNIYLGNQYLGLSYYWGRCKAGLD